jgi:hypothetical protein
LLLDHFGQILAVALHVNIANGHNMGMGSIANDAGERGFAWVLMQLN